MGHGKIPLALFSGVRKKNVNHQLATSYAIQTKKGVSQGNPMRGAQVNGVEQHNIFDTCPTRGDLKNMIPA